MRSDHQGLIGTFFWGIDLVSCAICTSTDTHADSTSPVTARQDYRIGALPAVEFLDRQGNRSHRNRSSMIAVVKTLKSPAWKKQSRSRQVRQEYLADMLTLVALLDGSEPHGVIARHDAHVSNHQAVTCSTELSSS
jgi:hypothetical protein